MRPSPPAQVLTGPPPLSRQRHSSHSDDLWALWVPPCLLVGPLLTLPKQGRGTPGGSEVFRSVGLGGQTVLTSHRTKPHLVTVCADVMIPPLPTIKAPLPCNKPPPTPRPPCPVGYGIVRIGPTPMTSRPHCGKLMTRKPSSSSQMCRATPTPSTSAGTRSYQRTGAIGKLMRG